MKRDVDCAYPLQRPPQNGLIARGSGHGNGMAEDRLMHLESMVKLLMESQRKDGHDVPVLDVTPLNGMVGETSQVEKDTTTYTGSTHWSAILDDIYELKTALGTHHQIEEEQREIPAMPNPDSQNQIIFGSPQEYSLQQIMAQYLPSKLQMDKILAIYFQGETYIAPFIHAYQFRRQYREFWENTSAVNPLWLSMLFSICCMGSLVGNAPSIPQDGTENDFQSLHTGAAKCLVLGRYHHPQRFSLVALAMYCHCKNLRTLDPSREVGAIVNMVVRMAYEMGYHRDPSQLGTFTVFEGEMRRRFWASCRQMDLMISFQLGLPSNIRFEDCDTLPPRHLLDSDFDESCQILPPSRSEDESTQLLWYIVKERQMISFSKVCQDAFSFTEKSEVEIVALDKEIREMQDSIPSVLRANSSVDSISDPPFIIVTRLYVDFISLKSLCVLHRKYMARGNIWSTQCCVEAGTTLVRKLIDMFEKFQPGGKLASHRWMLTNFTVNDFLMGVMLLCLIVHTCWKKTFSDEIITAEIERTVLNLLEQSYKTCLIFEGQSRDVRIVKGAILHTLNRAKIQQANNQEPISEIMDDQNNLLLPPWYGYLQGDEEAFGTLDPYNFNLDSADADWSFLDTSM